MAKKKAVENEKKESSKLLTLIIALLITLVWFVIFAVLIKIDIGGFGSGVLRPILKDVPVINKILPKVTDSQLAEENNYSYASLAEAVARVKELEAELETNLQENNEKTALLAELQVEVDRLKVFEEQQLDFEDRQQEFDKNVIYAENAPDIEEYKKYYEKINPANAELLYKQVVEQLQFSEAIKEKAEIYKNMKPEAAALILETLSADIESVAKILLSMKPKESASILAEMDSVYAAKITKKMLEMDEERLAD